MLTCNFKRVKTISKADSVMLKKTIKCIRGVVKDRISQPPAASFIIFSKSDLRAGHSHLRAIRGMIGLEGG